MGYTAADALEKNSAWVELRAAGVRGPWLEAEVKEPVKGGVHGGYSTVAWKMSGGAGRKVFRQQRSETFCSGWCGSVLCEAVHHRSAVSEKKQERNKERNNRSEEAKLDGWSFKHSMERGV